MWVKQSMDTQVVNAFSVDLEDWFQGLTSTNIEPDKWPTYESRIETNTIRLLTLLEEHQVKATFFVLGHIACHYPELIRMVARAGHEIGVHGYWHRMVHRLTPARFAEEIDDTLEALAPLVSRPIIGHRAPYFSINGRSLWALAVLKKRGFVYDSSFFPTRNMLYGYPQSPRFPHQVPEYDLIEFPVSTARWAGINVPIAGGFYVRALPYKIIEKGIRQLNQQGFPAILYVHPWELDTGQQYNQVTLRERITHYHGRQGLEKKLRKLFTDFKFVTMCELVEKASLP